MERIVCDIEVESRESTWKPIMERVLTTSKWLIGSHAVDMLSKLKSETEEEIIGDDKTLK